MLFVLVISVLAASVLLVWIPRVIKASQLSRGPGAYDVYVLIDPADSLDRDFLAGVKGARRTQEGVASESETNVIVLALGDQSMLQRQLCVLPSPLMSCGASQSPQPIVVLGPNTSTQVKLLHAALVAICEDPEQAGCARLAGCDLGEPSTRWNVHFLAGNATMVEPTDGALTPCAKRAWDVIDFAQVDNNRQAEDLFALTRGTTVIVTNLAGDKNSTFVEDMERQIRLQFRALPEKNRRELAELEQQLEPTPVNRERLAELKQQIAELDPAPRICDIQQSPRCSHGELDAAATIVALSGSDDAHVVLDYLRPWQTKRVVAADTWAPDSVLKVALDKGFRRLCVVSVRHSAVLKSYVEKTYPRQQLHVLPTHWRKVEMVRYSLGWDLYRTYAAWLRGDRVIEDAWVIRADSIVRQRIQLRDLGNQVRPIWIPEEPFGKLCVTELLR